MMAQRSREAVSVKVVVAPPPVVAARSFRPKECQIGRSNPW